MKAAILYVLLADMYFYVQWPHWSPWRCFLVLALLLSRLPLYLRIHTSERTSHAYPA